MIFKRTQTKISTYLKWTDITGEIQSRLITEVIVDDKFEIVETEEGIVTGIIPESTKILIDENTYRIKQYIHVGVIELPEEYIDEIKKKPYIIINTTTGKWTNFESYYQALEELEYTISKIRKKGKTIKVVYDRVDSIDISGKLEETRLIPDWREVSSENIDLIDFTSIKDKL